MIDQQAMADLCRALETRYAGRSVVAKYPFVQMLSLPGAVLVYSQVD